MDAIISAAVEEICLEGPSGVAPPELWTLLHSSFTACGLHPCDAVKRALWTRLIALPSLHLRLDGSPLGRDDLRIASPDAAAELGVKVVAEEHLRDSCLGIQELKACRKKFDDKLMRLLERIALSRSNGVTQDQLGKEFGMHGKEIFYLLKGLESNGVIVRQATVVKKDISIVNTNNLYLTRYARGGFQLNSHQRVEITVGTASGGCENADEDQHTVGDGPNGCAVKEDVTVRDYLPAMEDVCKKLEQASGKVLVASDIKKQLGYRKTKGHRLWRNILKRLKDANLVEEFDAKVNGDRPTCRRVDNPNTCLRLLKKFNLKDFQPRTVTYGYDDSNFDNHVQSHSKAGQYSEQVMELPLDHQIYDIIDGEGSKGIIVPEVYKRLEINGKKNYPRILDMHKRFQMPMLAECHNRTKVYRIWTSEHDPLTIIPKNEHPSVGKLSTKAKLTPNLRYPCLSNTTDKSNELEFHDSETEKVKNGGLVTQPVGISTKDWSLVVSKEPESLSVFTTHSSKSLPSQRHPCLDLTSITHQRRERIISRLQKDRFVLLVELQRWLGILETEKSSKMDKKTLLRILDTLEKDGLCKLIEFRVPSYSNPSSDRQISVICNPPFVASISEHVGDIYQKLRDFDSSSRGKGLTKAGGSDEPTQIISIERPSRIAQSLSAVSNSEAMRANGYVPAKMIRAKLLHIFLWSIVINTPDGKNASGRGINDTKDTPSFHKLFVLDVVLKALPVELFLQVVGFAGKNDNLMEYCRMNCKLSDLQIEEYRCLMDTTASSRLSTLLDILVRLKLIHLATEENMAAADVHSHVIVSHALNLKPYIERPYGHPCLDGSSGDCGINTRHYFDFLERNNVDDYWMTLEDYYAQADPDLVSCTFPGSAVREGCSSRAWSCVRVMSAEQRLRLAEQIADSDPGGKVSFEKCRAVAKELNLTLGQVLSACYDRRASHFNRLHRHSCHPQSRKHDEVLKSTEKKFSQKRKRSSKYSSDELVVPTREVLPVNEFTSNCGDPTNESVMLEANSDNEESHAFINQCVLPKLTRPKRFSWNDELDRQLVMQYAKYRAVHKADLHRVSWASFSNLPANPHTCRRRMAQLKRITTIRDAIMKLCNLLGERFLRLREMGSDLMQSECWDNFEDPKVKVALDEVLRCKSFLKPGNNIEDGPTRKRKCPGSSTVDGFDPEQNLVFLSNDGRENMDFPEEHTEVSGMPSEVRWKRLCAHRIPRRVLKLLTNKTIITTKHVSESLTIANAVELLKLIFLNASAASDVQTLLVRTLRQYSESDIYAAFNFLREKSFMIVGYGSRPFVLSQKFLSSATFSPFPVDTGRNVKRFSNWLRKQQRDNIELNLNLQCGEIFYLFGLVSSRRLNISACLPEEGIGEVDDSLSKQDKASSFDEIRKNDFLWKKDSDFCLRREKGFPGIMIFLDYITDAKYQSISSVTSQDDLSSYNKPQNVASSGENDMDPSCLEDPMPIPPWTSVVSYAGQLLQKESKEKVESLSSDLVRSVYIVIQEAGEQGLDIQELTEKITMPGSFHAECIVDTLEMFQLVMKVNAYDCIRVVDSSHRSKYFIATPLVKQRESTQFSSVSLQLTGCRHMGESPEEGQMRQKSEIDLAVAECYEAPVHGLSIDNVEPPAKSQTECGNFSLEGCSPFRFHEEGTVCEFRPILPWMNADGSNNSILCKGLVRRVLGTIMQNPGILEEDLIHRMDVLNPQSCRRLLELMIMDNHITVRKLFQTPATPPSIFQGFIKHSLPESRPVFRRHLFANPMSTEYL